MDFDCCWSQSERHAVLFSPDNQQHTLTVRCVEEPRVQILKFVPNVKFARLLCLNQLIFIFWTKIFLTLDSNYWIQLILQQILQVTMIKISIICFGKTFTDNRIFLACTIRELRTRSVRIFERSYKKSNFRVSKTSELFLHFSWKWLIRESKSL